VVAIFTKRLLGNKKAITNGDGRQTRDFVFVEDVVESNVLALKCPQSDIFDIGTGIETDINCIFRILKEKSGLKQKDSWSCKTGRTTKKRVRVFKGGKTSWMETKIQIGRRDSQNTRIS